MGLTYIDGGYYDDDGNLLREPTEKTLMMTQRCALPPCEEVIYRDTLDKDTGYTIAEHPGKYFCSKLCALESLRDKYFHQIDHKHKYVLVDMHIAECECGHTKEG